MGKDKTVSGTYNEKQGQISIYPLVNTGNKQTPLKLDIDFLTKEKDFIGFVFSTSIRTLIEEVLHVKYGSKYGKEKGLTREELETDVRQMTEFYFSKLTEWMETC